MIYRFIEDLFVMLFYYLLVYPCRLVFLSSRQGAIIHNLLFYFIGRITTPQPEHRRKFEALKTGFQGNQNVLNWQRRVYTCNHEFWKHALMNIFGRRLVVGSIKRRYLSWRSHIVPSTILVSLNSPGNGCNLSCKTCLAKEHPDTELPMSVVEKIIIEQEQLGIYSVILTGGEPLMYKEIWKVVAKYPRTTFWIATNGTLIGNKEVDAILSLGNVIPIISLDGLQVETDEIRGQGAFRKIVQAIEQLGKAKIPYLVTATVTKANFSVVTSDHFLETLVQNRCLGLNFSCYIPIGKESHPEWQITDEQSKQLDKWKEKVMWEQPIFMTVGANGTGRVSDCYAAKQYFHVLPDGNVEPCPFVKFSNGCNMRDHSILDITSSNFFRGVRLVTGQKKAGLTPCRTDKHILLKHYFVEELGAKQTIN